MGWFGNSEDDDLKKHSKKFNQDSNPEAPNKETEQEEQPEEEEETESDEEDEPESECAFQYSYHSDETQWECGLSDSTYCDKPKCPFWK